MASGLASPIFCTEMLSSTILRLSLFLIIIALDISFMLGFRVEAQGGEKSSPVLYLDCALTTSGPGEIRTHTKQWEKQ